MHAPGLNPWNSKISSFQVKPPHDFSPGLRGRWHLQQGTRATLGAEAIQCYLRAGLVPPKTDAMLLLEATESRMFYFSSSGYPQPAVERKRRQGLFFKQTPSTSYTSSKLKAFKVAQNTKRSGNKKGREKEGKEGWKTKKNKPRKEPQSCT